MVIAKRLFVISGCIFAKSFITLNNSNKCCIKNVTIMGVRKINLYVNDLRDCPSSFIVARTFQEAVHLLVNHELDILSLDHDLGEDLQGNLLPTGYDLVKYICKKGLRANKTYLHTDNPVDRENMYQTLQGVKRRGFIDSDIEIYHYPGNEY